MRLIKTHTNGNKVAKVYKDPEWEEFRVKHFVDGEHLKNADYHTNDKDDAHATAQYWLNKNEMKEETDSHERGVVLWYNRARGVGVVGRGSDKEDLVVKHHTIEKSGMNGHVYPGKIVKIQHKGGVVSHISHDDDNSINEGAIMNKISSGFNAYLMNRLNEAKFGYHENYDNDERSQMTWDGDFHVSHRGVTVSKHNTRNAAHEALLKHATKKDRDPGEYTVDAIGWGGRISKQFDHKGNGYSWNDHHGTFIPDDHPDHKLDEANSPKTAAIKAKYHRGEGQRLQDDGIKMAMQISGPNPTHSSHGFDDPKVRKTLKRSGRHFGAAEKADEIANAHHYGMHGTAMNRWGISAAGNLVKSAKEHLYSKGHSNKDVNEFVKSRMGRHFVDGISSNDASYKTDDLEKHFHGYIRAVAKENAKYRR